MILFGLCLLLGILLVLTGIYMLSLPVFLISAGFVLLSFIGLRVVCYLFWTGLIDLEDDHEKVTQAEVPGKRRIE